MLNATVLDIGGNNDNHCVLCNSNNFQCLGMNSSHLLPEDWQALIDRGFRRWGKLIFKSEMHRTCCPLYVIRLDTTRFRLTRSHKRLLQQNIQFLRTDKKSTKQVQCNDDKNSNYHTTLLSQQTSKNNSLTLCNQPPSMHNCGTEPASDKCYLPGIIVDRLTNIHITPIKETKMTENKQHCQTAADVDNLMNCRVAKCLKKARQKRWRRKLQLLKLLAEKLIASQKIETAANNAKEEFSFENANNVNAMYEQLLFNYRRRRQMRLDKNQPKSLMNYMQMIFGSDKMHQLKLRFVPVNPDCKEFQESEDSVYQLCFKYLVNVHHYPPQLCTSSHYQVYFTQSFLCLQDFKVTENTAPRNHEVLFPSWPGSYGPYHLQYWLDDKLIAVSVLDLLPHGFSSAYFFYDPEYSFLSLGIGSVLIETAMMQHYQSLHAAELFNMKYYYLGFYVHTCQKSNYKAKFWPSELQCPVSYSWHPIESCIPKIQLCKNTQLSTTESISTKAVLTDSDLNTIKFIMDGKILTYVQCVTLFSNDAARRQEFQALIKKYVENIGLELATRVFFRFYQDHNSL